MGLIPVFNTVTWCGYGGMVCAYTLLIAMLATSYWIALDSTQSNLVVGGATSIHYGLTKEYIEYSDGTSSSQDVSDFQNFAAKTGAIRLAVLVAFGFLVGLAGMVCLFLASRKEWKWWAGILSLFGIYLSATFFLVGIILYANAVSVSSSYFLFAFTAFLILIGALLCLSSLRADVEGSKVSRFGPTIRSWIGFLFLFLGAIGLCSALGTDEWINFSDSVCVTHVGLLKWYQTCNNGGTNSGDVSSLNTGPVRDLDATGKRVLAVGILSVLCLFAGLILMFLAAIVPKMKERQRGWKLLIVVLAFISLGLNTLGVVLYIHAVFLGWSFIVSMFVVFGVWLASTLIGVGAYFKDQKGTSSDTYKQSSEWAPPPYATSGGAAPTGEASGPPQKHENSWDDGVADRA